MFSTKQVEDGASLDAQRATLQAECDRRGWQCEIVADEGQSGKEGSLRNGPALTDALGRLDAGQADALAPRSLPRVPASIGPSR